MDARRATLSCDIDFEKQGRQISFLRLMYPDHVHDAGIIPIPIAVFSNGKGPTILLTAGTHGDEHEGRSYCVAFFRILIWIPSVAALLSCLP